MGSVLNPVHRMAAQKGLVEIIRRYIEKGGDVNATDSRGCSLLYWARKGGNPELCTLLVSAGAVEMDGQATDASIISTESGEWLPLPEQTQESALLPVAVGGEASNVSSIAEQAGLDGWVAEDEFADPDVVNRVQEQRPDFGWVEDSPVADDSGGSEHDGWVAEEEGKCLPSDEEFAARVRAIQAKITSHLPVDDAAGWSEVEIRKPLARRKLIPEAVSAAVDEQKVAALIAKIEADGRVSLAQIESIAPRIEGEIDDVFVDVAKRLVAEIGGFLEEDAPGELFDRDELLFSILKKKKFDEMVDVISFFDERYRGEKDAIEVFSSQMKRYSLLSPKEEAVAGKEMADCLGEAIRVVSRSKTLLKNYIGGLSPAKFAPSDEANSDIDAMEDPDSGQRDVSDGRDSASVTLLGEIAAVIEEAGEEEICERHFDKIENDLVALGFGFADAERLLRRSEEKGGRGIAVLELRSSVEKMVKKRNFLVERNLRLVGSVARRYSGNGCDLADLVQEGNIGLMKAAERWDYRLGYKFSTYAMWWIRQSITREIQDNSRVIRIPVHVGEQINACKREIRKHGGMPERELLKVVADAVGMDLERLRKILSFEHEIVSIDDVGVMVEGDFLCTDRDITEAETLEDEAKRKIEVALSVLDERQREVIRLRFGIGETEDMTLEQVGKEFGVTRERIRQIERKALLRLSKGNEADLLRDLLGTVN